MALTPSELRRRKMNLLMAMSYAAFASSKASAWSPTLLFAAGEQGAWYDPSDFSTMFQDAAGTTPVTAVEQPVGLLLDKSKGLALGADALGGAGAFSSAGSWSVGAGWSIGSGVATAANAANMALASVLTIGKWYKITLEVTAFTSGTLYAGTISNLKAMPTGTGTKTAYFLADATTFYLAGLTAFNGTVDNVVVNDVAGNHASQSTAASRPVLSARVNLLTYSEQFDNAAWTKQGIKAFGSGSVVNTTDTTDPLGTNTADFLQENTSNSTKGAYIGSGFPAGSYKISCAAKTAGRNFVVVRIPQNGGGTEFAYATFDLTTGAVSKAATIVSVASAITAASANISPLGNGWHRLELSVTSTSAFAYGPSFDLCDTGTPTPGASSFGATPYTGDGTSGIYIWGADLRVTNVGVGLPAYQRVGAAVTATTNPAVTGVPDYDTSGFPLYLAFDGTDDSLATGSIDFSATDKMSVFAGVRKLSDAASGIICELGVGAANGLLYLLVPNTPLGAYQFYSRGTVNVFATSGVGTTPVPSTNVLSGFGDIIGDVARLRVNGAQAAETLTDQGTGNYSNNSLYIGRRNNFSLPFNGNLYSLIVRGALSTDAQIASTETWVNGKTGAY